MSKHTQPQCECPSGQSGHPHAGWCPKFDSTHETRTEPAFQPDSILSATLKRLYVRPVIVAVSGGRDYKDDERIEGVLSFLHRTVGVVLLVEGACPVGDGGADERSRKWAKRNEVNTLSVPAKSKKYGWPACGPKRNQEMAHVMTPDIWVLFPGGKGTNSARNIAEENGIARLEVDLHRVFFLEGFRVTSGEENL